MYKKILAIIALASLLLGCNKELKENTPSVDEGVKFSLTASFDNPSSKVSYSEEDGSLKAKFSDSDFIQLYFLKENGDISLEIKLPVNPYTISEDGRKASFEIGNFTLPKDAVNIYAYLSSTEAAVTLNDTTVVDLSLQASFKEAYKRQLLCGGVAVKDIKNAKSLELTADVKLSYLTNIVKFALTLPKDAGAKVGNSTVITINNANKTIHKKVSVKCGSVIVDKSEMGDIEIYPTAVEEQEDALVAYAYACLFAGDKLAGSRIAVAIGEERYGCDLNFKKEVLEAGKFYTAARTLKIIPKAVSNWTNNEAGGFAFKYSGGENITEDWLKCENGKVSWSSNTSGRPRFGKLTFASGAVVEVLQLEPSDFKGEYEFTSKVFAHGNSFVPAKDPGTQTVTFGNVKNAVETTDYDGTKYTNNIGIKGMFHDDVVLDACIDIDYNNKILRLGLFLDARDGSGQQPKGKSYYATFLPALGGLSEKGWVFGTWTYKETEIGNPDYCWMWFKTENLNDFYYLNRNSGSIALQAVPQYTNAASSYIVGICAVTSKTNVFTHDTVSDYANVYQINPLGMDGLHFVRK